MEGTDAPIELRTHLRAGEGTSAFPPLFCIAETYRGAREEGVSLVQKDTENTAEHGGGAVTT